MSLPMSRIRTLILISPWNKIIEREPKHCFGSLQSAEEPSLLLSTDRVPRQTEEGCPSAALLNGTLLTSCRTYQ